MNFVDVSLRFQAEEDEENPKADSDIAPEECPNCHHSAQMRVVLNFRPRDVVTGEQAGTAQDALGKAFVTVERHVPGWKTVKKHLRPPTIPEVQADDLENMGILVGEIYDEKISREGDSG